GDDCGWPVREGAFTINPAGNMDVVFALPGEDSMYHYAYPVAQYDHDEGDAISGGFDYTGNDVPALRGKYVFGDVVSGRLFFVEVNQLERGKMAPVYEWQVSLDGVTKPLREICDNKRVDLRFGKDAHGNLYVFTKADGKVYRLAGD
ncbi:MAG: cytochrome C, partial [Cyclobacteriaceae bacterium]|nr:cytochrome C [Cyclobacteriaceae bacterium]